MSPKRHGLLDYVAGLTLASGLGLTAGAVSAVPLEVAVDALAEAIELEPDAGDRSRVLTLLAKDSRSLLRAAVAEVLRTNPVWTESNVSLLEGLVADPDRVVRLAAEQGFVRILEAAPIPRRLEVAAAWATSDRPQHRATIGRALAHSFVVPAADLVLTHLASDPIPAVRRIALSAAGERFAAFPETLRGVVEPRVDDPTRSVRRLARRLFVRASRA